MKVGAAIETGDRVRVERSQLNEHQLDTVIYYTDNNGCLGCTILDDCTGSHLKVVDIKDGYATCGYLSLIIYHIPLAFLTKVENKFETAVKKASEGLNSIVVDKGLTPLSTENSVCPKVPTGEGVKHDGDKILGGLLGDFSLALLAVAGVGTFGANKYTRGGWRSVPNGLMRYTDAMWRHQLEEVTSKHDEESGKLHAAHLAWNALARLELMLRDD